MLYAERPKKIYLFEAPVDFRKQAHGLTLLAESTMGVSTMKNSWFVFVAKDKRKIKILYWRGAGYALFHYKLESGRFKMPRNRLDARHSLGWQRLSMLISGQNIFAGNKIPETAPKKSF